MKFMSYFGAIAAICGVFATKAQPVVDGGLYQFINQGRSGQTAMASSNGLIGDLTSTTPNSTDKSQLWIAEAVNGSPSVFYLRNFESGAYVKANTETSGKWRHILPNDDNMSLCELTFESAPDNNSYFVFRPASSTSGTYRFAHEDAAQNIVTWGNGAPASHWAISANTNFSPQEIEAQKATWNSWIDKYVDGAVYRISNFVKPERCVASSGSNFLAVTQETESDNYSQLWQLTFNKWKTGVYLRNLSTGAYLTSSMATSEQWTSTLTSTPDPNSMLFRIETEPANSKEVIHSFGHSGNLSYMHNDASNNIVCWRYTDNNNSKWTFNLVESITPEEAAASIAKSEEMLSLDSTELQTHLDALFADKACTKLKVSSNLETNTHFLALPATLQQMALKIRNNDWSETDWDAAHARKFRVQLYEPFSRGWESSDMMGVQAYTNMNNPTGIIADYQSAVYVMVEDEIPEGSLLTIGAAPDERVYNDFNGQQQLHQGLNIVPIWDNHSLLYIYYTVDTWDPESRTRKYRVDDFNPVKIHIEGGDINGFFNAIGDELYAADTNDDWKCYRDRARHDMFDLIGEHIILHFFINNPGQPGEDLRHEFDETVRSYDIPAIIKYWDKLIFYQKMLMGVLSDDEINSDRAKRIGTGSNTWTETLYAPLTGDDICPADYHHYINGRMMGLSRNTGYMSGSAWTTNYNANTFNAILTGIVDNTQSGNLWGPAHEHGHVNQQPLKIAGTTEESNNVFSNIAVYYRGINTARTDIPAKQLDVFNSRKTFLENDTWGTTRMFYQLWLYYHAAGHNRKFYPRLFELLRQHPLEKRGGGAHLESRYDLLHFAKMCCIAAEEDLTDFFESWGFFVVQDDFFIDDYSQWHSYLSQADIDAVKAEIKAYNYPTNTSIIFIDDRPGSTRASWSNDMSIADAGTMGGIDDFKNGTNASGSYSFSINGTEVTVEGGQGGVGFLLYDSEGNLIGFSNNPTFTLSPEAAAIVASGAVSVKTVNSDSSESPVIDIVESGTSDQKLVELNNLIAKANELLAKVDPNSRKVGAIKASVALPLKSAASDIAAKMAAGIPDNELTSTYRDLADAYYSLLNNDNAYIEIIPGASYILTNRQFQTRILSTNGEKLTAPVSSNLTDPRNQWRLIPVDGKEDTYLILNESEHLYIDEVTKQSISIPLTDSLTSYTLEQISREFFSPYPTVQGRSNAIHVDNSHNVVSWNTSAEASQWSFSLAATEEQTELRDLVAATEALLTKVGSVPENAENIPLNSSLLSTNAEYDGTNTSDRLNWEKLWDNNASTIFHSNYDDEETTDGLDHYIQVQLPDNIDQLDRFRFAYTTRNHTYPFAPTAVAIDASKDNEHWSEIAAINSGLPTSKATQHLLPAVQAPADTRALRFRVTNSAGTAHGHHYFALGEFALQKLNPAAEPNAEYSEITPQLMNNAFIQMHRANYILTLPNPSSDEIAASHSALKAAYDALNEAAKKISGGTAIDQLDAAPSSSLPEIYDLQGRRVSAPRRGLYILDGRKLIIK